MTIHNLETFNQSKPANFDSVFDWDFMLPAFAPTKIAPMDFDAVIERFGNFLVFETKTPGTPVPRGQEITLESLVSTGNFTVIVLHSKTPDEIQGWAEWHFSTQSNAILKRARDGNADALVARVREWFLWASGRKAA